MTRGDVFAEDARNCLLYSTDRLIAAVGLDGHVVIETKDAVMVAPKSRVQDVKQLVDQLKQAGRSEPGLHREVFRPWGSYDSVDAGPRFQVKRLTVKPGAKLSLQKHRAPRRALGRRARARRGSRATTRSSCLGRTNRPTSRSAPCTASRIPAREVLQIIEVQSGGYLGEDDIVRLDDTYGRKGRTD